MSYNQYGGGVFDTSYSQVGGGGFLSPTSSGFTAPEQVSAQKKRDPQAVIPVTIKQLLEADVSDNGKFRIDGREVSQVSLIAQIISYEAKSTNVSYHMSDSTGEIGVKLYIDNEDADGRAILAKTKGVHVGENSYIRIIGNIRLISDQRNVIAFQLIPVTDFNEITMHYLDVIYCHLKTTRGEPSSQSIDAQQQYGFKTEFGQQLGASTSYMQPHQQGFVMPLEGNFTSLQSQILQLFAQDTSDSGASVADIINKLGTVSPAQIRREIEFLSDEGHLYSTINEDHFKCTVQ